jgi:hypothetical protein
MTGCRRRCRAQVDWKAIRGVIAVAAAMPLKRLTGDAAGGHFPWHAGGGRGHLEDSGLDHWDDGGRNRRRRGLSSSSESEDERGRRRSAKPAAKPASAKPAAAAPGGLAALFAGAGAKGAGAAALSLADRVRAQMGMEGGAGGEGGEIGVGTAVAAAVMAEEHAVSAAEAADDAKHRALVAQVRCLPRRCSALHADARAPCVEARRPLRVEAPAGSPPAQSVTMLTVL